MSGTTLISTIYHPEPVIPSILRYSPTKIILIRSSIAEGEAKKELKETVDTVERLFKNATKIEWVKINPYDLYAISKKTVDLIEKENGNKIIVNVTGGRKTIGMGVLFGCYARKDMIDRIQYVTEEKSEFVDLPLLSFGLSRSKRLVLEAIQEGLTIPETTEKLKRSRGMIYAHLKELQEAGLVDENYKITTAGRIALL